MQVRSNLTSEICPKVESLDEKTKQNRLKAPSLPPSFQKTTALIEKQ